MSDEATEWAIKFAEADKENEVLRKRLCAVVMIGQVTAKCIQDLVNCICLANEEGRMAFPQAVKELVQAEVYLEAFTSINLIKPPWDIDDNLLLTLEELSDGDSTERMRKLQAIYDIMKPMSNEVLDEWDAICEAYGVLGADDSAHAATEKVRKRLAKAILGSELGASDMPEEIKEMLTKIMMGKNPPATH